MKTLILISLLAAGSSLGQMFTETNTANFIRWSDGQYPGITNRFAPADNIKIVSPDSVKLHSELATNWLTPVVAKNASGYCFQQTGIVTSNAFLKFYYGDRLLKVVVSSNEVARVERLVRE